MSARKAFVALSVPIFLLLLLGSRGAFAVTCDSYRDVATCNRSITDQGHCLWNATTTSCAPDPTRPLEPGMVAITSIQEGALGTPGPVIPPNGTPGFSSSNPDDAKIVDLNPDGTGKFCSLPYSTGPCRAALPRYYYNSATSSCERFIYGGCEHNDNYFQTVDACNAAADQYCRPKKRGANTPPPTPLA